MREILSASRTKRRLLRKESRAFPKNLVRLKPEAYAHISARLPITPDEVWRNNEFLVLVFYEKERVERLSVCRTDIDGDQWKAEISWDDLQSLKSQCGRGAHDAVEVYPADADVVNVANMRHLFVLPEPFALTWRQNHSDG